MTDGATATGFVEVRAPGLRGTGAALLYGAGTLGFIAALVLMMTLTGTGLTMMEGDRGLLGVALAVAGVVSAVWVAGFLWRRSMRRTRQETIRRMLPGFTGRTIPVGGLVSGPKAAGELEGRYLLAVGADAFLVLRHFHDPARFDAMRAWLLGQFVNVYGPDCAASPRPLKIPFAAIDDIRLRTVSDEALQQGAFGRAVGHGLASAALDAMLGARSLADTDAAFVEIVMKDGQAIVFGAPSRTPASLVSALARTADGQMARGSDDASFREVAGETITQLLERSGQIEAPADGWGDFFAGLKPEGHRARAFAALAALRLRQETGREGPRRITPPVALEAAIREVSPTTAAERERVPMAARRRLDEALLAANPPLSEQDRVAALAELDSLTRDWMEAPLPSASGGFDHRARLIVWSLIVLLLALIAIAIDGELVAGGRADVTTAASIILIALAALIGVNLFAARSGWLTAGWRSAVTFVAAVGLLMSVVPDSAFADGAGRTVARLAAAPFVLLAPAGAAPSPAPEAPTAEAVEAARRVAAAEAETAADAEQRQAAERDAARVAAAEAVVRDIYASGRGLGDGASDLRRWMAPALFADLMEMRELEQQVSFPMIDFDPVIDGQDADLSAFEYETRLTEGGAESVVRFRNFGEPVRLTYSLVETPDGWRVTDIWKIAPTREEGWRLSELIRYATAEAQITLDQSD
jgi:hypothetical protein